MNGAPYVFLSYCHEDAPLVLPVVRELERAGLRLWFDEGIAPGSSWPEVIADKIGACTAFLAFLTPASLSSHSCRSEFNFAMAEQKHMLCVLSGDPELTPAMKMHLASVQAIEAEASLSAAQIAGRILEDGALAPCMGERPRFALVRLCDGARFPVLKDGFMIGRSKEQCDLVLSDGSVSRRHAYLTLGDDLIGITDNSSMNGVTLNGVLLDPGEMCEMEPGDEIGIGQSMLLLEEN